MALGDFKDFGCLGVLILGVIWVGLFFTAIYTEAEWLIMATSLSPTAIPLGFFIGHLLAGRH